MDELREELRAIHQRHAAVPEMVAGLCVPYFRRGEMSDPDRLGIQFSSLSSAAVSSALGSR